MRQGGLKTALYTALLDAERKQEVAAGGAGADRVARAHVHHTVHDDGARDGDLPAAPRHLVDGVDRLRGVVFPELLAVGGRHGEQAAITGAFEDDTGDRGRRGAERRSRWREGPGGLAVGVLHRAQTGGVHAVVHVLTVGRAAPHDAAAAAAAEAHRLTGWIDAEEDGAVLVGVEGKDVRTFRAGKERRLAIGKLGENRRVADVVVRPHRL